MISQCVLSIPTFILTLLIIGPASTFASTKIVDDQIEKFENNFFDSGDSSKPQSLLQRMRVHNVPGVSLAVINGGKIEWAKGYGFADTNLNTPVTTATLFQAASISKSITAMTALILVEEGKLNLDSDVNNSLNLWKVPKSEWTIDSKITLRKLLSHTAGINVSGFLGYTIDNFIPTLVEILTGLPPANSQPIRSIGKPGQKFQYSGGGYTIVQQLINDTSGKGFAEEANIKVFSKFGMGQSSFEQPLPVSKQGLVASGHDSEGKVIPGKWHIHPELAAAGLWTTPTDLAKFALHIQQSLNGISEVPSTATAKAMTTPVTFINDSGYKIGLGLVLEGEGKSLKFWHNGGNVGYRCLMLASTHNGQGVVVMTNADGGADLILEIKKAITRVYNWDDPN